MTLACTPFALVSTYRSTAVPSAVLPNAFLSTPAFIFAPPFALDSAAVPGEPTAQSKETIMPTNPAALMEALLVANDPVVRLRYHGMLTDYRSAGKKKWRTRG